MREMTTVMTSMNPATAKLFANYVVPNYTRFPVSLVRGTGNSELSPQQREVALLLAQGKTNPEIAQLLGLTINTASYHVKQVYLRLQVNNREAVQEQLLRRAQLDVAAGP